MEKRPYWGKSRSREISEEAFGITQNREYSGLKLQERELMRSGQISDIYIFPGIYIFSHIYFTGS